MSKVEKDRLEYNQQIENIMNDCLKDPKALIDAEALASHISSVTESRVVEAKGKSGTDSNKSG